MSCTHEMRQGSVVTVINAGGLAGGCSFCKTDALEGEVERAKALLARSHGLLEMADKQPKKLLGEIASFLGWPGQPECETR